MKTKEELNELKEEVETVNKKLAELTEEELKEVAGGFIGFNQRGFSSTNFPAPVIPTTAAKAEPESSKYVVDIPALE